MDLREATLKRSFSELEPWQTPFVVLYGLMPPAGPGGRFGVQICEVSESRKQCAHYADLRQTRREAEKLLRFLYENAVLPAHLAGVVQDLMTQ